MDAPWGFGAFSQTIKYLLGLKQASRDLSQVTNCKQEKAEPTSKFWVRFNEVWIHLGGMELSQTEANPLFLSTFLVNCRPEIQEVLKHHLSDRNNLTVRQAGEKIRTLESDGMFDVKNKAYLNVVPGIDQGKDRGNRGKFIKGGQRKGKCHYCGKEGHWIRECRKKQADERNQRQGGVQNVLSHSDPPPNFRPQQQH